MFKSKAGVAVFLVYISMFSSRCLAADLEKPPVIGLGNDSCSFWPFDKSDQDILRSPYSQWVLGTLSGKNLLAPPKEQSIYLQSDVINILHYMEGYCRRNPDKNIAEAVLEFTNR